MVSSLSQQGNNASPSGGIGSFGTPSGLGLGGLGLGVDMGTPGTAGMVSTPAMGASMVPTMSDLGLTASGGQKRNEDEERKARLRRILKSIGRPKGRVSEEGIARVARRVGFENDIDTEKLTQEELAKRAGNRQIGIAGESVVLDVTLKNHEPQSVQVAFANEFAGLEEQAERAGKVLLADLKRGAGEDGKESVGETLDRFATDMEWLAKIDRLSKQKVDCFSALSGLYSSLKRLHEQETAGTKGGSAAAKILQATCKKSGTPLSHEYGRLGLSIDYWRDHRQAAPPREDAMDVDSVGHDGSAALNAERAYTLRLEIEPSTPELFPSIRVSDAWLPDPLDLTSSDPLHGIPWQDPPPTFIPNADGGEAMAVDGSQKLPELRFVAKLDPPIVMPWQTATNIMNAVGAPAPQAFPTPSLYHALLLGDTNVQLANTSSAVTAQQEVLAIRQGGQEEEVHHAYRLNIAKAEFGFKLEELPFSHPRQLVELLPTLRQWACAGKLLKQTFSSNNLNSKPQSSSNAQYKTTKASNDDDNDIDMSSSSSLDEILSEIRPDLYGRLPVDIAFAATPTPTLSLTFPALDPARGTVMASLQVKPNGGFDVILPKPGVQVQPVKRLARALDVVNDLGVWVEWLRSDVG